MKLPNGERATVDVQRKLIGYCLNNAHRTGRHKARVFEAVLGITAENAGLLADALLAAARKADAKLTGRSADAVKYEVEFSMTGPRGTARVRSGWIIERGRDVPRLTSCYVKPNGGARATRTEAP